MFSALGTELGVEVDNEIIEIAAEEAESEDEYDYKDEETFEEENDIDESVEIIAPDFDCPDAGFYPSPTDCGQYYQCTADRTVTIYVEYPSLFLMIYFSPLCSPAPMDFITTPTLPPVIGLRWSNVILVRLKDHFL